MQAVLLAAGRGVRMGSLTKGTPKPLLEIMGESLIERVLHALPEDVHEYIIVVAEESEQQIRRRVGSRFRDREVRYVEQVMPGTGGALFSAKRYLSNQFMVVNSDDAYSRMDLETLLSTGEPAQGVVHKVWPIPNAETILFDADGYLTGRRRVSAHSKRWFGTGAFFLDRRLWRESLVQRDNGEYSLPHTVTTTHFAVKAVPFREWMPINTPSELLVARNWFADKTTKSP